jgi:hypothetical protein
MASRGGGEGGGGVTLNIVSLLYFTGANLKLGIEMYQICLDEPC